MRVPGGGAGVGCKMERRKNRQIVQNHVAHLELLLFPTGPQILPTKRQTEREE